MPDPIRVLVVDDHAPFRAAVGVLCLADGVLDVVAEAASVAEALEGLAAAPDLAVVDVNLGEVDGIEGARLLLAQRPDLPIVLCSTAPPQELPPLPTHPLVTFVAKEELDAGMLRAWYARHGHRT